jgi:hypothetical protein
MSAIAGAERIHDLLRFLQRRIRAHPTGHASAALRLVFVALAVIAVFAFSFMNPEAL